MDYETADRLLRKYRKNTRPKFFSAASGQETEITAEFEAELILMDNSVKRSLVQRLRGITDTSTVNKIALNLLTSAITYDTAGESDRAAEAQAKLGDLQEFQKKLTDASSSAEMLSVTGVLTASAGPVLFEYDQAVNRALHDAFLRQTQENQKSTETKRELNSWISVVSTYITA